MFKVNIITPFPSNEFSRQLPPWLSEEFEFHENGDQAASYDMVVVYEGVTESVKVNCSYGNLIFIAGEPPASRFYTKEFLRQFNHIISSHKSISHPGSIMTQQALPWHFGLEFTTRRYKYSYDSLRNIGQFQKSRPMSIIASGKNMMPGHAKRKKFVDELRRRYDGQIDFFGRDINPVNDKADAIIPYYFTICIENSNIDDYWTEKIADAYLGLSLPVYYGCTNIDQYFPMKSYQWIDVNNEKQSFRQIDELLGDYEKIYQERFRFIAEARDLLMDKYNIYPFLANFVREHNLERQAVRPCVIRPNHSFNEYKTGMYKLRLKRYFQKWIN